MKTPNYSSHIKYVTLITVCADIICTLLLGFLFTAFLVTGVVYPVHPAQQELLKAWGIEPIFIQIVWLEYLIPLIAAILVTYKLIRKFELWTVASTVVILATTGLISSLMGLSETPIVIKNIVIYPFIGWFIGQTIAKLIVLAIGRWRPNNKDLSLHSASRIL